MLTFLGSVGLVLWLWQRQGRLPSAVGEVEAIRVDVAVRVDGLLAPLSRPPWQLLEQVEAQQLVARLDDRPLQANLDTFRAELVRLRKTLEAEQVRVALEQADRQTGHLGEAARLAWQVEQHRLRVLELRAVLEGDRVALRRLDARLEFLVPLHQRGAVSDVEISDARLMRDEVAKRVAETEKVLAEAERHHWAARQRLQEFPPLVLAEANQLLSPVEAAVSVQEATIRQLQVQAEWLEIRAPLSGTIVAIYRHPGQTVRAGEPVMTIAAQQGRYILSYVPQEHRFRPEVGMAVEVRPRLPGSPPCQSLVEQVGPQVELIPEHQRRDPRLLEWGQPVRIMLPEGLDARPGELLDIVFRPAARGGPG